MRLRQHSEKKSKLNRESTFCIVILAILAIACIIPIYIVVIGSLTPEYDVQLYGYSLFPETLTLNTYKYMFLDKVELMGGAMWLSAKVVVIGTLYTLTITTCFAYAVTQKKDVFPFSRPLSFFAWLTTVIGGGILPWYILCTQYYGLRNNIFALFIPYGMSVFNMFIIRGGFRSVPYELVESAKLDGASHFRVFAQIAIPLARGSIITVALFNVLMYWNDFHLPQWLMMGAKNQTFQKLIYSNMQSSMTMVSRPEGLAGTGLEHMAVPQETLTMAMAVSALVPIVLMYPFALKYFVKGINVGGVKG